MMLFEVLRGRLCIGKKNDRLLNKIGATMLQIRLSKNSYFGVSRGEINHMSLRAFITIAY